MPSKSPKQKRFMAAAANSPDFARRAGIDQDVAKEFFHADQASKHRRHRKARTRDLSKAPSY